MCLNISSSLNFLGLSVIYTYMCYQKFSRKKITAFLTASKLVFCSAYWTLKLEAIFSSELSVDFQETTRRYIPEDSTLHNTSVGTSNHTIFKKVF
jgi:hypothetical protein